MARRRLSDEELLRGAEKALRNRRTPKPLRAGIRKLRDRLRKKLEGRREIVLPAVGRSQEEGKAG